MTEPTIEPPPAWDGCLWPVDPACLDDEWNALPEPVRTRAQRLMTATLQMLTGYVVGGCPVTIRPVLQPAGCVPAHNGYPTLPDAFPDYSYATSVSTAEVELPWPVGGVLRVLVDGVALDPADYQVQNGNLLTWVGSGDPPWPLTQDVRRPDSEAGTFSVTYLNSYPVDANGQYAGGILALEFARACTGASKGKCRLPSTVRSIARQGLTFEIPAGAFPEGLTGIREADTYIQSVKPYARAAYASSIYDPNRPPPRVVPTSVPL